MNSTFLHHFVLCQSSMRASQLAQVIKNKNPPANAGSTGRRYGFNPLLRKILWRRKWKPTPTFLPGASRGQRSITWTEAPGTGFSPWGCKELDMTEHTHTHVHIHIKSSVDYMRPANIGGSQLLIQSTISNDNLLQKHFHIYIQK